MDTFFLYGIYPKSSGGNAPNRNFATPGRMPSLRKLDLRTQDRVDMANFLL